MPDESMDLGQRAKSLVDRAKHRVGVGDAPLASEVGGREEAMREALRAFGAGEIDRFLSAFAEDVEWFGPDGDNFPGAGTHRSRDAIREQFVDAVGRSYQTFGFVPERCVESPGENLVVALGAFSGEALKGSGRLEAPAAQLWEFDGDKVAYVQIYADTAEFPELVTKEDEEREQREDDGEDERRGKPEDQQRGKPEDDDRERDDEDRDDDSGERDG
jgi:ketosteroid isomerase-like protein